MSFSVDNLRFSLRALIGFVVCEALVCWGALWIGGHDLVLVVFVVAAAHILVGIVWNISTFLFIGDESSRCFYRRLFGTSIGVVLITAGLVVLSLSFVFRAPPNDQGNPLVSLLKGLLLLWSGRVVLSWSSPSDKLSGRD
jgi:hypothetical protein